jgi:O-methyltransferase involved in polyketide biosynthesis
VRLPRLPAPQVICLGAGFDTSFFNLAAAGVAPARYIEIDFPEVRERKRKRMQNMRTRMRDGQLCADVSAW